MKYSKWIGIVSCILLIAACFIPWTYHADVGKNFTGFISENNEYGKPGKFIIFFSLVSLALILLPKIWAKRTHLFIAGFMVAYTIKTYILYSSCYNAYCPDKKAGIYLIVALSVILFFVSIFPDLKINDKDKNT